MDGTVLLLPLPPGYEPERDRRAVEVHTATPGPDELRVQARLWDLLGVRPAPTPRGGWS